MAGEWRARLESPWVGPVIVAAFAFAIFSPSIAWEYTLDDREAILSHPAVVGEVPFWEVFVREYWGRPIADGEWSSSYRPLTSLTFAFEHRITTAPWVHHLGNCLWFAVLCGVVTWIARRWSSSPVALAVGLSFAALPIHVESVASIVGRADVLASLLAVLSAHLALARGGHAPSRARIAGAALLYFAALLCKETVALLPGVVGVLVVAEMRARGEALRAGALASTLAIGVVGLGYLLMRHTFLSVELPPDFVPADNLLVQRTGFQRAWGNLAILGHYIEITLVPVRLCSDHTYAEVVPPLSPWSLDAWRAWLGVVVVLAVVRDGYRAWLGRSPGLWCATALAFLLVGQWVISLSVILAERLALWPSIWLAFAIAHAASHTIPRQRLGALRIAIGILVGLFAARTLERTFDWRDNLTLHRAAVDDCPRAVHSRFILARLESDRGNVGDAVWHYALSGAGRSAFPGPFDVPALDVEDVLPLDERLRRLPDLVSAPDAGTYWAGLHGYLASQGREAEARLVVELASEAR